MNFLKFIAANLLISFIVIIIIFIITVPIGYLGNFCFDWRYSIHLKSYLFAFYVIFSYFNLAGIFSEKFRKSVLNVWD